MATFIENIDGVVSYENQPDVAKELFPNEPDVSQLMETINELRDSIYELTNVETGTCEPASGTPTTNSVKKIGKIVFLDYVVSNVTISGTTGNICTLPEGFRPPERVDANAELTYNGTRGMYNIKIQPTGVVQTQIGSNNVTMVEIRSLVFPVEYLDART